MRKLAFLSMDDLSGYVSDDALAATVLQERGWDVETLSWRQKTDWRRFDMVIIRTTWDYQNDPQRFLATLAEITALGVPLHNPIDTVRWNFAKTYLRDLQEHGHSTVPTLWKNGGISKDTIADAFSELTAEQLIIKPVISANADNTFPVDRENLRDLLPELQRVFAERAYMIQPFIPNVISEGEYSLIFFAGQFSHAILKTPKSGDFRVQEEHGGIITAVKPPAVLLQQSAAMLNSLPSPTLYARVDWVRLSGEQFGIMEAELIEPALYFRMDSGSAARFADAVTHCYSGGYKK